MNENDITLGELSRVISALKQDISGQFAQVNRRLDNLQYVPRDVYQVQIQQLTDRVDELEESKRWQVRTLVASFLFPVLVAVVIVSVGIR